MIPDVNLTTLDQQINQYYRHCEFRLNMTPKSMESKRSRLDAFRKYLRKVGISDLKDLTNDIIDDWVMSLKADGNCGRTINGKLDQVRVLLRYARDKGIMMPGLIISDIVNLKMEPARQVHYTEQQINKALSFADLREWLMIKLSFDCALRISELRNLRLSDIDGRTVCIREGKGRKRRYEWMSENARRWLSVYIERDEICDYLWPSGASKRRPMDDHHMRKMMKRPFQKAGMFDFYPHALRHSCATILQERNAPIGEISVILGHAYQTTTERYMHSLDDRRPRDIMEKYMYVADESKKMHK